VLAKISDIVDPELKIGIVDLGLIYDVRVDPAEDGKFNVDVDMTLTSIACPVGPALKAAVQNRILRMDEVNLVNVYLVFDPPWDVRKHASEDAQMELGII